MRSINSNTLLFVLSLLTHPVFLPAVFMYWYLYHPSSHYPVIYATFIPSDLKRKWLLLYVLSATFIPLIILFFTKLLQIIRFITLESTIERKYFFLLMGVYYWIIFYIFYQSQEIYQQELFKPSILLIGALSVIMFILSFGTYSQFKISLHAAGYGLLTAFFVASTFVFNSFYLNEIIICILLSTLVMIVRLLARAHYFSELLVGWLIGLYASFFVFLMAYQNFNLF